MNGIVIAGTQSGSGKTSVSLGLMAALAGRGMAVQPFKAGPDFIDPGHHALATGRESHNLDGWICSRDTVRSIFARHAIGADVSILEGVMGLFDGASPVLDCGSTAELAKWLGLPVVLVVDARSMARSASALVRGYAEFDPELSIAGVIFNKVGSPSHAEILREAVKAHCPGVAILGCLPRDERLEMASRHLGLVTAEDASEAGELIRRLAKWAEAGLDFEALTRVMAGARPASDPFPPGFSPSEPRALVGVARDRAFCFYYRENLRLLEQTGAELVGFSPLADKKLPEGLDGIYLGGGYPELHAMELANNRSMRKSVRAHLESGRPAYAECGGFMYLMQALRDPHGRSFPMAEWFPFTARMNERRAALGYREITTLDASPLGPAGVTARGHEFHYSSLEDPDADGPSVYAARDRKGEPADCGGYLKGNVLGSYVHLHFGSNPEMAENFVAACARGVSKE